MAMPAIRRHWTTADVRELTREDCAWPRYELIDGELLVTPAPKYPHQFGVLELAVLLHGYLAREPIGVVLVSPSDLELRSGTITQPDVFVIPTETGTSGDTLSWTDVKSLLLAIEVISPSSLRTDRVTKRDFYLANGVEEYWIVDIDARCVERWKPTQERPDLLREQIVWAPRGRTPLVIDLPALFESVEAKRRMMS